MSTLDHQDEPAFARRAQRTPYRPITGRTDEDLYMDRWWLFNPYRKDAAGNQVPARWRWLPSIRVHHIVRPDDDEHEHNHPWFARSIILRGGYLEERREEYPGPAAAARLHASHRPDRVSPDHRSVVWRCLHAVFHLGRVTGLGFQDGRSDRSVARVPGDRAGTEGLA